jgi:tRNA(His) 5'-end guanylyltransferase
MKFDELDAKMRVFETAHDHCVLPGIYIVARLDGRSFTKLTKEIMNLDRPFDVRFRNAMVSTTQHLMKDSGVRVLYGFTESDEISLLLHPEDDLFGRKLRKLNSILAGEASAFFSRFINEHTVFDCRISQLPTIQNVVDYFRWRQEDAARNALTTIKKDGCKSSYYCFKWIRCS